MSVVYQEVVEKVQGLDSAERMELLKYLTSLVSENEPPKPKRSLLELEGLGKEIWEGIDAQEYVNQERDSWER
jgi:hypothetical protein